MSSTANAASGGQIRSGLRALGESLRRGRRKVCPVLGLIEIETASKSLFSLSVQNVSVCAKSNVGTLVAPALDFRSRCCLRSQSSRGRPWPGTHDEILGQCEAREEHHRCVLPSKPPRQAASKCAAESPQFLDRMLSRDVSPDMSALRACQ